MAESPLGYKSWQTLDGRKRYCLADTMVLLQIYRRDARLASMAETVRDGRTLLLVPALVDECAAVFNAHKPDTSSPEYMYVGDEAGNIYEHLIGPATKEDVAVEPQSRSGFDRLLAQTLRGWGIEFTAARPEPGALDGAETLHARKTYKNRKGKPLSLVDCLILRLAVENDNVDVITDDLALARAVSDKCGEGRASNALGAYFGRLNMTARFLSDMLDLDFVYCNPIRNTIEYRAAGARQVRASQDTLAEVRLSHDGIGATYGPAIRSAEQEVALFMLSAFIEMVMLDWYCACGDANWAEFDKKWGGMKRDVDTGQPASKTSIRYYDTAKRILRDNRWRYCACSKSGERHLHEEFKSIMSEVD